MCDVWSAAARPQSAACTPRSLRNRGMRSSASASTRSTAGSPPPAPPPASRVGEPRRRAHRARRLHACHPDRRRLEGPRHGRSLRREHQHARRSRQQVPALMRPMRPGPQGKRGWLAVQRGTQAGGPAHHPQNVAPLRMAGDPHFARTTAAASAGAGPFVVFGDACPTCSVPSVRTPEIVRNKRSLSWCPVRRRIARGAGEPPRAYSNWSSGFGAWPPSRRNSRRAASTSA